MSIPAQELLSAAGRGQLDKVQRYVASGLEVDAKNEVGYSALMSAARSYRIEVVVWLISAGADVNAVTHDGQSVLHAAVGETPSQSDRQAACVAALLNAGARADVQTPSGHTPLMQAAWFGCLHAVKILMDYGASQDIVDKQGRNALQIAEARGHSSIVDVLDST